MFFDKNKTGNNKKIMSELIAIMTNFQYLITIGKFKRKLTDCTYNSHEKRKITHVFLN